MIDRRESACINGVIMTGNYYHSYLQSSTWKERRSAKLQQAKYKCKRCGERIGLQVHHLNYDRLGDERTDDLIVLCRACHWVADVERKGNNELRKEYTRPIEIPERTIIANAPPRGKRKYNCVNCGAGCYTIGIPYANKMRLAKLCEKCFYTKMRWI